jgi:hypothetical protein
MTPRWVKLELDVATFDVVRFSGYVNRCQAAGIRLATLAELGDTAAHRRALYELNKECSADIGFAALCGVDRIRTVHHPANVAVIEMNRRLGYVDAAWD